MQVNEVKNENLAREYEVTVPAVDIDTAIDDKLKQVASTIKMDGFRPGKVPLKLVKKKHGKRVLGEVLEKVVSDTSKKVISEKDLRPALQPKIEIKSFNEGDDLAYSMSLEIYPEVPDVALNEITITKLEPTISEDDIKEGIERLCQSNRDWNPIAKDRAAKEGDIVVIDFEGKVDDVAFEGGTAEGHQLELGTGAFIPGFEDQLIGSKKGDEKDVNVTFPEEYGSSELAGKDAVFHVKVHDILEASDPEVNDELAKKIGFDDLDKLKEAISEQLTRDYSGLARTFMKKELFDKLDKLCGFDVPEGMTSMELNALKEQTKEESHEHDAECDHDHDHSHDDKDATDDKELETLANRRVRLGIYLADIGRKNDLQVTEDELRQAVFAQARSYPGQEMQVFEYFQNNVEALESLKGPIIEDKAVDYLFEKVTATSQSISTKELMDMQETEEEKA